MNTRKKIFSLGMHCSPYQFFPLFIPIFFITLIFLTQCANEKGANESPYKYDLDSLKKIDPKYLTYKEIGAFKLPSDCDKLLVADKIFVTASNELYLFHKKGKLLSKKSFPQQITALESFQTNLLLLAFNDEIEIFNTLTKTLTPFATLAPNAEVVSIACVGKNIYLSDYGNSSVYLYDDKGALRGVLGEEKDFKFILPSRHFASANKGDGEVLLVNPGRHKIITLRDLTTISEWGKAGFQTENFTGCCNPIQIQCMGSHIYTAEKGIPRIKKYDLEGNLIAVVAASDFFEDGTLPKFSVDNNNDVYVYNKKVGAISIFREGGRGVSNE